jgi:hypothetical protein
MDIPPYFDMNDVTIRLYRDGCHGFCPQYLLTIHPSGLVEFVGMRWVSACGNRQKFILPTKISAIIERTFKINFFNMEEKYEDKPKIDMNKKGERSTEPNQDHFNLASLTISIESYSKRVISVYGNPKPLFDLMKMVDDITESQKWVHVNTNRE